VRAVTARLKLIALDTDDLAVISAHVQDARVQTGDIIWRQGEKRLVVGMNGWIGSRRWREKSPRAA